ncbi:MAG: hypothetical protein ABI691_06250 [Ginsengibacter sp.]
MYSYLQVKHWGFSDNVFLGILRIHLSQLDESFRELTKSYDLVYNWFHILKNDKIEIIAYVIMPQDAAGWRRNEAKVLCMASCALQNSKVDFIKN